MAEKITQEAVEALYQRLKGEAEAGGYRLNPDVGFVKELVRGLLENEARYGYWACPCRLASGDKPDDLDIICPCDYRDPDLSDYGACFCALYVSAEVEQGKKEVESIPERRPVPEDRQAAKAVSVGESASDLAYPVWRCKVCGYLCARDEPPEKCPICKVDKERFERFM